MEPSADYKVTFGKIARTLLYEDSQGVIRFGFVVGPSKEPSKGKWTVNLERPSAASKGIDTIEDEQLRMAEQKRLELAFERTKKYLASRGYQVKVWPDDFDVVK
jgi:hypothetical protein